MSIIIPQIKVSNVKYDCDHISMSITLCIRASNPHTHLMGAFTWDKWILLAALLLDFCFKIIWEAFHLLHDADV